MLAFFHLSIGEQGEGGSQKYTPYSLHLRAGEQKYKTDSRCETPKMEEEELANRRLQSEYFTFAIYVAFMNLFLSVFHIYFWDSVSFLLSLLKYFLFVNLLLDLFMFRFIVSPLDHIPG